jgi:arylformamidase
VRRFDISFALKSGMPGFPGDTPVSVTATHQIARGNPYNLSQLVLGSHSGTHVDPPSHFIDDGTPIDRIDLEALNGRCRVVTIPDGHPKIEAGDIDALPSGTQRVLFRTPNSERWEREGRFFPDYVACGTEAATRLVQKGLRLVGIDSLSIELDPARTFPVHHTLLGGGVLILEGLLLAHVPEGEYELRCLPLRIEHGDGGPARAVLLSLD